MDLLGGMEGPLLTVTHILPSGTPWPTDEKSEVLLRSAICCSSIYTLPSFSSFSRQCLSLAPFPPSFSVPVQIPPPHHHSTSSLLFLFPPVFFTPLAWAQSLGIVRLPYEKVGQLQQQGLCPFGLWPWTGCTESMLCVRPGPAFCVLCNSY